MSLSRIKMQSETWQRGLRGLPFRGEIRLVPAPEPTTANADE